MGKTIAEKILASRTVDERQRVIPGDVVRVRPDLVLLNDVNGPVAFRHFNAMDVGDVVCPDKIALVIDHFAPAPSALGAQLGSEMRAFAKKHGIRHFFDAGKGGIEHTLVPEQGLVSAGDIIVGGDSHSTTFGAFNAFGTPISWAGVAGIMALGETWFRVPESIRFEITGCKEDYVTGKDVILWVLRKMGAAGALYKSMEFGGLGLAELSIDERMAICNMAVEVGAKTGIFEADPIGEAWAAETCKRPYELTTADADAVYHSRVEIDLSSIPPLIARPYSPDNVVPVDDMPTLRVDQVYMGNCANGTLTDLRQIARILRGRKVADGTRAIIVPATQKIYRQALKEGLIDAFVEAGAIVSTPTCGACFGAHNGVLSEGEVAVATINRNFRGRGGHHGASVYLANSYVAAAAAVAGEIIHPAKL